MEKIGKNQKKWLVQGVDLKFALMPKIFLTNCIKYKNKNGKNKNQIRLLSLNLDKTINYHSGKINK